MDRYNIDRDLLEASLRFRVYHYLFDDEKNIAEIKIFDYDEDLRE